MNDRSHAVTNTNGGRSLEQIFSIGETVRVRGETLVYKVLAMTGSMITILIANPQPDGTELYFNSISLRTVDGSNLEKV